MGHTMGCRKRGASNKKLFAFSFSVFCLSVFHYSAMIVISRVTD